MERRTLRTLGASIVLAGVGLAGVAQVDALRDADHTDLVANDPSPASHDTIAHAGPETTTPEPFTYRVGVLAGLTTDNFWAFYGEQPSAWNSYVHGPTKAALFTWDAGDGDMKPDLAIGSGDPTRTASGWEVVVDLDPGRTWSDGTPVTAHDLVFTFETVRSAGLGGSWVASFPESVTDVNADGDYRVRIAFSERPHLAVWPYGVGFAPLMASHVWSDLVEDLDAESLYSLSGATDVGGGPLSIDSISGDLIVAVANPGGGGSAPDSVEYRVFADDAAALAALDADEIDFILSPQGLTDESLEGTGPGIATLVSPGNGTRYLGFNLKREPMSEPAFRKALALLVDRDQMARSIPNAGPPALVMLPEENRQWYDAEAADEIAARSSGPFDERLQTALEGLLEAGYTWEEPPTLNEGELVAGTGLEIDGQSPATLTILTTGDEHDPARARYSAEIANILGVLGFDARPVETDFDTVVDLAFSPDEDEDLHYDMYLLGWTLGNPALPGYHHALFSEGAAMNNTGYDSAEFSEALRRFETAYDHDEAREALWAMERIVAADLPYLVLYGSEVAEAYRSDRVSFTGAVGLGGIQARHGGVLDVEPAQP